MKSSCRICVVLSTVLVLGESLPYQHQQPSYYHERWREREHPRFYPPPVHEWPIRSYQPIPGHQIPGHQIPGHQIPGYQIPGHQVLTRPYPGPESTNFQQVQNYPAQAKSFSSATSMINTANYAHQNINPHTIKKISIPLGGGDPRVIHLPTDGDPNNMKIIRVSANYDGTYDDTDIPEAVKKVLARALAAQRGRKMHNDPANAHASALDSDDAHKPGNNIKPKNRGSQSAKPNAPVRPFNRGHRPRKNFKSSTNAPVFKASKSTVIITEDFVKAAVDDSVRSVDENLKKTVKDVKTTTAVTPKAYKTKSTPAYVVTTRAPRRHKYKHRYDDAPTTPKTAKPTENDYDSPVVTPSHLIQSKLALITSTTNKLEPTDTPITSTAANTVQNVDEYDSPVDIPADTIKTTQSPLEQYQLDIIKPIVTDNAPINLKTTNLEDSDSHDSVYSDKNNDYNDNDDNNDNVNNDNKDAEENNVDKNSNPLIPSDVQPTLEPVPTAEDYDSQDMTPPAHATKPTLTDSDVDDDDDEQVTPRQITPESEDDDYDYKKSPVLTYKHTSDPDYKITPRPAYKPTQDHVNKLKSTFTKEYNPDNKIKDDTPITPKPEKSLPTDDSNTPISDDFYPSYPQSDKNKETDDDEYPNDTNTGSKTQGTTEDSRSITTLGDVLYDQVSLGLTDVTESSDNLMDVTPLDTVTVAPDSDVTRNDLGGEDGDDHATKKDECTQDIADTEKNKNNDTIINIEKKNTSGKDKIADAHETDDLHKNDKNVDKVNNTLLHKDKDESDKAKSENEHTDLSKTDVVNNDRIEKDVSKTKEFTPIIAKNEETNTTDKDKQSETIANPDTVAQDKLTEIIDKHNTVVKDEKIQPIAKYKEDDEATVNKTNEQVALDKDNPNTTNAPAENVETFEDSEETTVTSQDATIMTKQDKQATDDKAVDETNERVALDKDNPGTTNASAENVEAFEDFEETTGDQSNETSEDDDLIKQEPLTLSNFLKYLIKNAFKGKTYLKKMFDEPNVQNFLKSIFHF